eukprot:4507228-Pleurochrysis_carterae.AAC.1
MNGRGALCIVSALRARPWVRVGLRTRALAPARMRRVGKRCCNAPALAAGRRGRSTRRYLPCAAAS